MLPGWATPWLWARVHGIYDVTIARHQTLRSHAHTCLAYINQAKQIFIGPYCNVIIIRYWIGTEPQNCINWSVLNRTNPLFPGSFEHYHLLLLLSLKADIHFTIPQRVEGWVDLAGWLHTEMVYLSTDGHPSWY